MANKTDVAVIGLGTFGIETARALMKHEVPVIAVDSDKQTIDNFMDEVTTALVMDSTDKRALREAEIHKLDKVIVAIGAGGIENSIMTTALLKELNPNIHIIARATSDLHRKILEKVGADRVVNPEEYMGKHVARSIAQPYMLTPDNLPNQTYICVVAVPNEFVGKSIAQINIRREYSINIMGIMRPKKNSKAAEEINTQMAREEILELRERNKGDYELRTDFDPHGDKLNKGDCLLIMGNEEKVSLFQQHVD